MKFFSQMFGHSEEAVETVTEIPILLRFWEEDGVWNGEAVNLPVAVFGTTFEESRQNMHDAVISHLQTLNEVGTLMDTISMLKQCARIHKISIEEMGLNQPFIRFNAAFHDQQVFVVN